ncbi:hypothetical protein MK805_09500 [Shimazuella sp. AN120528]|uniref:hypothetical protein n=1 Tax=Shimazuella soli TaxID=1892854 RepID=UPI001F0F6597|nr:hypothetical protein [Shimazuella soli]MCH5585203.1 hypothetical protein [Shimazuella soli]
MIYWVGKNLIPDNPCDEVELIPEDRFKTKWIDKQVERRLITALMGKRLLLCDSWCCE